MSNRDLFLEAYEYFRATENYLRPSELKGAGSYLVSARNSHLGIFVPHAEKPGFVIRREKLGSTFLFVEYHWDLLGPYGTVKPLELVEMSPFSPDRITAISEYVVRNAGDGSDCNECFNYLEELARRVWTGCSVQSLQQSAGGQMNEWEERSMEAATRSCSVLRFFRKSLPFLHQRSLAYLHLLTLWILRCGSPSQPGRIVSGYGCRSGA